MDDFPVIRKNAGLPDLCESSSSSSPTTLVQDHPLAALARTSPEGAERVMHRLIALEHRKLDTTAHLAKIQAKNARFSNMSSILMEQIRTHPDKTNHEVEHKRGLCRSEKIVCRSWK